MKRWMITGLLILLLGAMVASTFASHLEAEPAGLMAQDDGELVTVRVGTIPAMVFAPVYLADLWGYFAEEGLAVDIVPNPGGAEPLAPLASGNLDVVISGFDAAELNYAARNLESNDDPGFRIVMGGHSERPPVGIPLVVSADRYDSGEITQIEDLAGKRIAINATGVATEYWLFLALEQGGLTLDDVEVVTMPFPEIAAALNSGDDRVDAAILGEPLASSAEAKGLVKRLSTDFVPGFQATFVYMSTDFLETDPEAAAGFMRALIRTYRDLQNPEIWRDAEVVAYLNQITNGYTEELLDLYAFPSYEPDGQVVKEDLVTLQDYFLSREQLDYEEPLDLDRLLDRNEWERVVADLEQYATPEPGQD